MRTDDALRVLGLSGAATPGEVKAAYRRLVKIRHPDRFSEDPPGREAAEKDVKRIIEAYRCLKHAEAPASPTPAPSSPVPGDDAPGSRCFRFTRRRPTAFALAQTVGSGWSVGGYSSREPSYALGPSGHAKTKAPLGSGHVRLVRSDCVRHRSHAHRPNSTVGDARSQAASAEGRPVRSSTRAYPRGCGKYFCQQRRLQFFMETTFRSP